MVSKRELTEARLKEALQRLLDGCPIRTKSSGRLSLNKINNEAGCGNSYINHFTDFVRDEAKPAIKKYNETREKAIEGDIVLTKVELSEKEVFRVELQREKRLKERYRHERDDARKAKEQLEALNNTLMFRLFDLQEELSSHKVVSISSNKN